MWGTQTAERAQDCPGIIACHRRWLKPNLAGPVVGGAAPFAIVDAVVGLSYQG